VLAGELVGEAAEDAGGHRGLRDRLLEVVRADERRDIRASPTSQAIDGLGTLLTRPDWRSAHGAELTTILTAYLDDPNPALRARATYRLLWVYPDPADALKQIEQRLSIEDVPAIQWALINALAAVAGTAPLEVDAAIGRLATQSRWSAIASSLTDDTGSAPRTRRTYWSSS
jgi:hypothetical protein